MRVTSSYEKQDNMKVAFLHNKRNQINGNVQKLKKAQKKLIYTKKNN